MRKSKGFTLIELIVVMAIISILVLLGVPKYKSYTEEAQLTRIKVNIKEIEKASQKYYMTFNDWPRLNEEHLTSSELESYSAQILDLTGEEPTLDANGKYYELDYESLEKYVTTPNDKGNYILQNPVGAVLYLKGLTAEGEENLSNVGNKLEEPQSTNKGLYSEGEIADFVNQGYVIVQSPEDLDNVRNNLSGKYIQVCDIDLSGFENWLPIGTDSNSFTGIYNGGGFEVSNLTINTPTATNVGLFGSISGSNISNIGVTNVMIKGKTQVGGLVGHNYNKSIISNTYCTGTVAGSFNTGGLVGYSNDYNSSIINSYFTGNVTGIGVIGGLVGLNKLGSIISNCFSTGDVSGSYDLGGLVGYNFYSSKINTSYSICAVIGDGDNVGGLVGSNSLHSVISDSYSTGAVAGRNSVGGLAGCNRDGGKINTSYSISTVKGSNSVGGLVGFVEVGTTSNSYWDKETTGMIISSGGTGKTTLDMYKQSTYLDWDFDTIWEIKDGQSYPILQWQN